MKPIRSLSPNEDVQKLLVQLDANGDGSLEVKEIDHNEDGYIDAQLFPKGWDDQQRISVEHALFSHHLIQKIRDSSQTERFYQDLLQDKELNNPTNFLEDGNFNRIDHGKKRLDLFYKGDAAILLSRDVKIIDGQPCVLVRILDHDHHQYRSDLNANIETMEGWVPYWALFGNIFPVPDSSSGRHLSFEDKFEIQKNRSEEVDPRIPPFRKGDRIQGIFFIDFRREDPTQIMVRPNDIDGRLTDEYLISVTKEEYQRWGALQGIPLKGGIEITGDGKYGYSNVFIYPAKVITLTPAYDTNPMGIEAPGVVANLPYGSKMVLEGTILDETTVTWWDGETHKPRDKKITLQLSDGRKIFIYVHADQTYVPSPLSDNVDDKKPEVGDVIRLETLVTGASKIFGDAHDYFDPPQGEKILQGDYEIYLLQRGPTRQRAYDQLRQQVKEQQTGLAHAIVDGKPAEARKSYAKLFVQELTPEERTQLIHTINQLSPAERPIIIPKEELFIADDVNKRFDVDIHSMTHPEFLDFVDRVTRQAFRDSQKLQNKNNLDESYIFRILKGIHAPNETIEKYLTQAIDARLNHFLKGEGRNNYDHDRDWDDAYMIISSLSHLAYLGTPTAATQLIDYANVITLSEQENQEGQGELLFESISRLTNCLDRAFYENNQAVIQVFKERAPHLWTMDLHLTKLQINNPRTRGSHVTFFNTNTANPLAGLTTAFQSPGSGGVRHLYSSELEQLRGVLEVVDPQLQRYQGEDLHKTLLADLQKLAKKYPVVQKIIKAVEGKGYQFITYDEDDPQIPLSVRWIMNGRVGAATYKGSRVVYFNMNALVRHARMEGIDPDIFVLGVLVHEGIHILSDVSYDSLSAEQSQLELEKMEVQEEATEVEKKMQMVILEEIFGNVVQDIVMEREGGNPYQLLAEDFKPPSGKYVRQLNELKIEQTTLVLINFYRPYPTNQLNEADFALITRRLTNFLNSGKVEAYLVSELKKHEI